MHLQQLTVSLITNADFENRTQDYEINITNLYNAIKNCLDESGVKYTDLTIGIQRTYMRTIIIKETDYYAVNNYKCITYDLPLYDKLHDAKIKKGEILRLLVQEKNLYCNILVEDIEYGDGTIWIKHLIEKS